MNELLVLAVLFGFSFLLRAIFILTEEATDDYSHLWMVREQMRRRDLRQHQITATPLEGVRGYPPLGHYLTGLFPKRHWSAAGKLLNILYDCISVATVFIASFAVFSGVWNTPSPLLWAFLTGFLYSTTPVLFPVTSRLRAMGARTLGGMFINLFIVAYGLALYVGNPWLYPVCVVLLVLTILSSQFAMQFAIWLCILLSAVTLSPLPAGMIAAAFFLLMLPPLDGWKLMHRKLWHIRWYKRYIRANRSDNIGIQGRNKMVELLRLPYYLVTNPRRAYMIIFYQNSYLIAAYSVPVLYPAVYYTIAGDFSWGEDPLLRFGLTVVLAAVSAFALTSLKSLLIFGQAERYLEFAAFPLALLFVHLVISYSSSPVEISLFVLAVNLMVVFIMYIALNMEKWKEILTGLQDDSLFELVAFLKELDNPTILTLPTKMAFSISYRLGDGARYYFDNICNPRTGMTYMLEEHEKLHFFKPDPEYFHMKYGVDTFVVSRAALSLGTTKLGINYDFEMLEEVFQNSQYIVYRYPEKPESHS